MNLSLPVFRIAGRAAAALTIVCLVLIGAKAGVAINRAPTASASQRPVYLDPPAPVQARVNDLLGRMTLPEKVGQMVQIEVTQITDTSSSCTSQGGFNWPPNPACMQKILIDNHAGSILAGGQLRRPGQYG